MNLTEIDLADFVIREARMLDEQQYEEWLELFTEDGIYWMPLEFGQTEEKLTILENLRKRGLISEQEYREKRQYILDGF